MRNTNPMVSDDLIFLNRDARFSALSCLESLKPGGMLSALSGLQNAAAYLESRFAKSADAEDRDFSFEETIKSLSNEFERRKVHLLSGSLRHGSEDRTPPRLVDSQDDASAFLAPLANVGGNVREEDRAGAVDVAGDGPQRALEEGVERLVCRGSARLRRGGFVVERNEGGGIEGRRLRPLGRARTIGGLRFVRRHRHC